jgi:hypothetical protein
MHTVRNLEEITHDRQVDSNTKYENENWIQLAQN